MSGLYEKIELMNVVKNAFDDFTAARYKTACGKGCSVCCTRDLLGVTIEAHQVREALIAADRRDLIARLEETPQDELFRPKITTNTMAMAILTGNDPPEEEGPAESDRCPLLEDDACVIYEARPFSCRGMFSTRTCRPGSDAEMPPDLVTLVTVCWQIVEHIDAGGLYGNLIELVPLLDKEKVRADYEEGETLKQPGLPPTRPTPGFLVPPEEQGLIQEFLEGLFKVETPSGAFREAVGALRPGPF